MNITEFDLVMDAWLASDAEPGSIRDSILRDRVHYALLKEYKQELEASGQRHLRLLKSS